MTACSCWTLGNARGHRPRLQSRNHPSPRLIEANLAMKNLVLRVISYFILSHLMLVALQAQNGNISGTVTDPRLGALAGAQVHVEGQSLSTSTDDSGRYRLLGIPVGTSKVTVSYLGLEPMTREVNIASGLTATLDFTLSLPKVVTEVTVTDSPDLVGQARALNDQKNSI